MYEVHIYDKFITCNMHIHSIARILDIQIHLAFIFTILLNILKILKLINEGKEIFINIFYAILLNIDFNNNFSFDHYYRITIFLHESIQKKTKHFALLKSFTSKCFNHSFYTQQSVDQKLHGKFQAIFHIFKTVGETKVSLKDHSL